MASLPDDCNSTIAPSSTTSGTNRKRLKSTIDCRGVKNITVALPDDIMMLIVNKLDVVGFQCFSAVCRSWQSVAIAAKKIQQLHLQRPQLPWLMFYSNFERHPTFFSHSHGKIFKLEMLEAQCVGSNWGWLIMVDKMARNFLLNPFTRSRIELPPQATLPADEEPALRLKPPLRLNCICKALLLSPPAATTTKNSDLDDNNIVSSVATDNCVVLAIYRDQYLVFCRAGDEGWTGFGNYHLRDIFEDIIFYDGKLYTITRELDLILVELGPHPKLTSCNIAPPPEENPTSSLYYYLGHPVYLVECLGELLLVIRCECRDKRTLNTSMFKLFKLDPKGGSWIKVEDLGDQMLFIGTGTGFSLSARDYPGFRGNCIYFTVDTASSLDYPRCGKVAALFNLEDNSFETFFSNGSHSPLSEPIWFTPFSW